MDTNDVESDPSGQLNRMSIDGADHISTRNLNIRAVATIDHDRYLLTSAVHDGVHDSKWTLRLLLCAIAIAFSRSQFGFCIGSISATELQVKRFVTDNLFFLNTYDSVSLTRSKLTSASFVIFVNLSNKKKQELANLTKFKDETEYGMNQLPKYRTKHKLDLVSYAQCSEFEDESIKPCRMQVIRNIQTHLDELNMHFNLTMNNVNDALVKIDAILMTKQAKYERDSLLLEGKLVTIEWWGNFTWMSMNVLYGLGGGLGALLSPQLFNLMNGRQRNILAFDSLFSFIVAVLVFNAILLKSPVFLISSRVFAGIQAGLSSCLVRNIFKKISKLMFNSHHLM